MLSEAVNNTEQLRFWFRTCPTIAASKRFGVDYSTEKPEEYAIISVPSTLKTHENILGEEVLDDEQTQNFLFASNAPFGADTQQNLLNLGFHQAIVDWIIEQNAAQNFPEWNGGRIKSILPTLTAAPIKAGSSVARYQIQLKIKYRRV